MPENLPPELQSLRVEAGKFVDEVLRPLEASLGDGAAIPREIADQVREVSRKAGFFYKTQPAEFGGKPSGVLELTMLRELFAGANLRLGQFVFGPGPGILQHAEGDLKRDYQEPVLRGEKRGAFGFTEPDDAKRPTWAKRDGEDLLVTGRKSFVTGGAAADFVAVLLNVEEDANGPGGSAMVLIDRNAGGVQVDRIFQSLDGSNHASVSFDGVRVPMTNIIGKIGEGMPRALGNIGNVRLAVSAQATGICMFVLEFVERHLLAPHRTGIPLGEREGVRLRYADMRIATYAARSVLYRTARILEQGEDAVGETMATKVFCTETAGRVVDDGVQLVGGQALVGGHPLEALYRQARALRFMEGASDLLRINLVKGKLQRQEGRV